VFNKSEKKHNQIEAQRKGFLESLNVEQGAFESEMRSLFDNVEKLCYLQDVDK